ncbi:hypothetical protein [Escherichia coli]|uniref:gp53-like domain-containing protein n=1 Tax=Escherichia coli TaxID=562 RepID=UPI003A987049
MLYNTGTIAINGNSATGTGTNWTAPASQVRAGQTIIVMSNPVQMFQISSVNSATSMTVTPAASPALSGQKYGILVSDNISVDGLAQAMSQLIKEYDENIGAWETFATTSANQSITVTINGTTVTIPGIGKLAQKGSNGALAIADGGTGATNAADARTNLGLNRIIQIQEETRVVSPGGERFLIVKDDGFGLWDREAGPIPLEVVYGGTGAKDAAGALANFGIGPIATAGEIQAGTAKKLVDAERLIGAIASDTDIQNKAPRKLVDSFGLINAITTMQDVQDGALRKFVNALTLKNYLPVKALSGNGFIRIPDVPGGTIIQYGQVSGSISEGVQSVVYPTPFPNATRFAIAIPLNLSGNNGCDLFAQINRLSATGCNFYFSWATGSTPADGFQWFALGY